MHKFLNALNAFQNYVGFKFFLVIKIWVYNKNFKIETLKNKEMEE